MLRHTTLDPVSLQRREAMDYERWVNQQMDLLKMKSMTTNLSISGVELPKRLGEKIFKVSVDERNLKGETLMIAVIRYVDDEVKQASLNVEKIIKIFLCSCLGPIPEYAFAYGC